MAYAASLATINCIETRKLAEHASNLGQYALKRISEMMERSLFKDMVTRERANDESEAAMYSALSKELGVKLSIRQISYRLFVNCHGQNDFRYFLRIALEFNAQVYALLPRNFTRNLTKWIKIQYHRQTML